MRKLLFIIAAVVLGIPFAGWMAYQHITEVVHDSYAVWWVAGMVIEHVDANAGQWPQSWEELRDDYQTCVERLGEPWSFEELRSRVCVDWTANATDLRKSALESDKAKFRVVWLADGSSVHWEGAEPNQLIYEYLSKNRRPLVR
jgi:hypothetical protein